MNGNILNYSKSLSVLSYNGAVGIFRPLNLVGKDLLLVKLIKLVGDKIQWGPTKDTYVIPNAYNEDFLLKNANLDSSYIIAQITSSANQNESGRASLNHENTLCGWSLVNCLCGRYFTASNQFNKLGIQCQACNLRSIKEKISSAYGNLEVL